VKWARASLEGELLAANNSAMHAEGLELSRDAWAKLLDRCPVGSGYRIKYSVASLGLIVLYIYIYLA
jgi:hypothetical protein